MRSYIIRGFLPWIVYLSFVDGSLLGLKMAIVATASTILLLGREGLKRKFLLDWATLLFLVAMSTFGLGLQLPWIIKYSISLADIVIASICFISIIINRVVTLEYARTQATKVYWHHPIFVGANIWITAVWGLMFLFATISTVVFNLGFGNRLWLVQIIPTALLIFSIFFTMIFPDVYKSKKVKHGTVAGISNISPIKVVKVGALNIAYRTLGNSGPLLLLLNGACMNMHNWDPDFLNSLAQNFQLLIIDYPGCGYSSYKDMVFSADTIADCIKQVFDKLKKTPAAIIGYSMGGWIAQTISVKYPDFTKALILIATDSGGKDAVQCTAEIKNQFCKCGNSLKEDENQIMKLMFPNEVISRFTEKFNKIFSAATLEGEIPSFIISAENRLAETWYNQDNISRKSRSLPTLLIAAKQDMLIPFKNVELMQEQFSNIKLIDYSDAGHGLIYQYPMDIADHINKFFYEQL